MGRKDKVQSALGFRGLGLTWSSQDTKLQQTPSLEKVQSPQGHRLFGDVLRICNGSLDNSATNLALSLQTHPSQSSLHTLTSEPCEKEIFAQLRARPQYGGVNCWGEGGLLQRDMCCRTRGKGAKKQGVKGHKVSALLPLCSTSVCMFALGSGQGAGREGG